MKQTTNTVVMVRPIAFRSNEQTAIDNHYQNNSNAILPATITAKAQKEFDGLVIKLRSVGVTVIVIQDTDEFDTPDAIFPNNWISFHENGTIALYPMFADNRRLERREEVLELVEASGFVINDVVDYTSAEEEGYFLEGTGSMVLDRVNRKAYCALSKRSDEELFIEFCEDFEYTPVVFFANQTIDGQRKAIYHTNVMLSIAETFALVCIDAIDDKKERKNVLQTIRKDGKEIIKITENQANCFAGNMLQLKGKDDKLFLIMSQSAYNSLSGSQIKTIESHCVILSASLEIIEAYGGGSARCMMTEVFLPLR